MSTTEFGRYIPAADLYDFTRTHHGRVSRQEAEALLAEELEGMRQASLARERVTAGMQGVAVSANVQPLYV